MAQKKSSTRLRSGREAPAEPVKDRLQSVIAELRRRATNKTKEGMARYGLPSEKALGVTVGTLKQMAKRLGKDHDLALALWATDVYEARMLATFVDEPSLVTPAQMDRWCGDFDNWGICDTACFALFDRTPHAWTKVRQWSRRRDEFVKRAAFALLASLTVHDKKAGDEPFADGLVLIERASDDDRNFVKKAVNWALRSIGKRSSTLHAAALSLSERLAVSSDPAARWIGKDALRELTSPSVRRRLAGHRSKPTLG
jgi:3-methyladenine DNA glycosylase AlkD